MEKEEALENLNGLLQLIKEYESAESILKSVEKSLDETKHNYQSKLKKFDDLHKESYIYGKIGPKPQKPEGGIKALLPGYKIKMSKYMEDVKSYDQKHSLAESAYKKRYAVERKRLEEEDESEKKKDITIKEEKVKNASEKYEKAKRALEENEFLSGELKAKKNVVKLIEYLMNHRADTLKEAVNLWYDEKRKDEEEAKAAADRKKLIELQEEQTRAAQAAEEYAKMQYEEACNASFYASQAADDAREAKETAQQIELNELLKNYSDID